MISEDDNVIESGPRIECALKYLYGIEILNTLQYPDAWLRVRHGAYHM